MTRRAPLMVAALVAACLVGASAAFAGFTAGSSNPGSSFAAAADFCAAPGEQVIPADKDAYIIGGLLSGSEGGSSVLWVRSSTLLSGVRRTLVGFDLPPTPSHCDLVAASLRLYATSADSGRTIQAFRAGGPWTEDGVNWGNAPEPAGPAASSGSGTGWRSWNVLSQVGAMYSGANNGFVIRDQSESNLLFSRSQQYQSREGSPDSSDPELRLTFE